MKRFLSFSLLLSCSSGLMAQADLPTQTALPIDGQSVVSFVLPLPTDAGQSDAGKTAQPLIIPQTGKVAVTRKWNEKEALISVPFENKALGELKIRGVQTTGSLYLISFPATVPVGGRGEISLVYSAIPGVNADKDLIRLLTNQGEKLIEVTQDREPVMVLSAEKLQWAVGEPATSKTVSITVADHTITPKAVRTYGAGNTAELKKDEKGGYIIVVTPASTAKPTQFPVMVDFEPALTGVPSVIYCSVVLPE